MMQEINLLKIEKRAQKLDIDFSQMVKIVGMFVGILLLVSIYEGMEILSQLRAVNKIEADKKIFENELANKETFVPLKQSIDQLTSGIEIQIAARNMKQDTLNKLIESEINQAGGFSEYMAALSRKMVPGLWLTHMDFNTYDAHYALAGKTLQPDLIPKFLQGLSQEPIFSGKTFQVFKVSADKSKGLNFLLETRVKPEKKT